MTRFRYWRKMTWALVVWSGAALTWFAVSALTRGDAVAGCAVDAAGVATTAFTRRECVEAATGGSLQFVVVPLVWFLGVMALGGLWWMSRPLWRQGRGARLRRMRPEELEFVPRPM